LTKLNAHLALDKILGMDFKSVLDIGSGAGVHADILRKNGRTVTTISLGNADIVGDFITTELGKYDCVWASHVLEHQTNVGLFLNKCFDCLNYNGILAVTVPPSKPEIVGGHLTTWNAGLLLYNLILAGFDCSEASVKTYGYNISVVVRKKKANLTGLHMDYGDIERIKRFFPFDAEHGFNGNIGEINW
jgi:SAM-dependent methyltransferase